MTNAPRPRLVFYCQHVLGMGHYMRSAALLAALHQHFDVTFVNGGGEVPGVALPSGVRIVSLPEISSDEDFRNLEADGLGLDEALERRRRRILEVDSDVEPDVVVVELFPFGRKKFARELIPWLAAIRRHRPETLVACSVRDILVSRDDQERHDQRVVDTLNRYFDLVLVHSDERFQSLPESFGAAARIEAPVEHTGYVIGRRRADPTGLPELARSSTDTPLVTASIGGGRVGCELLAATVAASADLAARVPHRLVVATGPFIADDDAADLAAAAAGHDHIEITSFVESFDELLSRSDLSISMAGYNTCMNLAVAGVAALVLPFTGGDNDEQSSRAARLATMGAVEVLSRADIDEPRRLATRMEAALGSPVPPVWELDLGGAAKTAEILALAVPSRSHATRRPDPNPYEQLLAPMSALDEPVDVFFRDDDIGAIDDRLLEMIDIGLIHHMPMTLAVVPTWLTKQSARRLKDLVRAHPGLIELHQHGLRHINHETTGKKHEFGPSRDYDTQVHDIGVGLDLLRDKLGMQFFPAFTPPWNRCTDDTHQALADLGFLVLSKDVQADSPILGRGFVDLSTSVDIFTWKNGPELRSAEAIAADVLAAVGGGGPVGILLHHEVMDDAAMTTLDQLCEALAACGVRGHTFASLLRSQTRARSRAGMPG